MHPQTCMSDRAPSSQARLICGPGHGLRSSALDHGLQVWPPESRAGGSLLGAVLGEQHGRQHSRLLRTMPAAPRLVTSKSVSRHHQISSVGQFFSTYRHPFENGWSGDPEPVLRRSRHPEGLRGCSFPASFIQTPTCSDCDPCLPCAHLDLDFP